MNREPVTAPRLWAWLFAAVSAPLAAAAGGSAWYVVLAVGIAGAGISWGIDRLDGQSIQGKVFWAVQYVWATALLGKVLPQTQLCWNAAGNTGLLIPVTVLLLAVCASLQGTDRAGRAGSVLFWVLLLIYGVILAAGLPEVHVERLTDGAWKPDLVWAFLIPAAGMLLPHTGKRGPLWRLFPALFACAISVCAVGTLSAAVAADAELPFYEAVRGMRLFHVAERFEALLSAGLTVGWFALLTFLLCLAGTAAERLRAGLQTWGIWLCAGVSLTLGLVGAVVPGYWCDGVAVLLWAILPAISCAAKKLQKSKKSS